MMKRLTLLVLLLTNGWILIAQNALLPAPSFEQEKSLLPHLLRTLRTTLENPVPLPANLPAGILDTWCPLEITDCPQRQTKYLVIVTLDGFRWQEMFGGADSILLKKAVKKPATKYRFLGRNARIAADATDAVYLDKFRRPGADLRQPPFEFAR
jgi:hypothetical protein